jgi:acyl-CoA thioesterase II
VFGGQVIAQALQAAQRSVDGQGLAHSLHAYFMRAGRREFPIVYRVTRDFDGKSFATRRVVAMQQGQPILNDDRLVPGARGRPARIRTRCPTCPRRKR